MKKDEIRKLILGKRREFDLKEKKQLDEKVLHNLEFLPEFKKAQKIVFYVSQNDEVDTRELIKKYFAKKRIIVPRVKTRGDYLELIRVNKWGDLQRGCFGILEPKQGEICRPEEADLFIVPGVVFDKKGNRLGYGHGFFDKLLKKTKALKIGLAYSFQVVDLLKVEDYDVPVDVIVTEKGIMVANSR